MRSGPVSARRPAEGRRRRSSLASVVTVGLALTISACTASAEPSPTISATATPTSDEPSEPTISAVESGPLTLLEHRGLHEVDSAVRGTLHAVDGCLVMEYSTDGKRRGVVLPEGTWYDEADRTIVHGDDSLLLDDDARLLPATGFTAEQLEATAPDDCSNASYVVIWELRPVERAPEND